MCSSNAVVALFCVKTVSQVILTGSRRAHAETVQYIEPICSILFGDNEQARAPKPTDIAGFSSNSCTVSVLGEMLTCMSASAVMNYLDLSVSHPRTRVQGSREILGLMQTSRHNVPLTGARCDKLSRSFFSRYLSVIFFPSIYYFPFYVIHLSFHGWEQPHGSHTLPRTRNIVRLLIVL